MNWTALVTMDQWHGLRARASAGQSVLIFKHSTRCSISAAAEEEMIKITTDVLANGLSLEIAQVLVVEHRPVSLQIADDLAVVHKSPQLILLKQGNAVWDTSHWAITRETVLKQLRENC